MWNLAAAVFVTIELTLLGVLIGCGKEEPKAAPAEPTVNCFKVRVVAFKDAATLMETLDAAKTRYSRTGFFGSDGDEFTICEK